MALKVELTHHAREKIKLLQELGFPVSEEQVVQTVLHPDRVESGNRDAEGNGSLSVESAIATCFACLTCSGREDSYHHGVSGEAGAL